MNWIKLILAVLFLFVCGLIDAQKIPFDNYTVQNGLPQNVVNDIDQDVEGYIWFATQVGAARFDGYEFEYFNTSNGLPDDLVNCLLMDHEGHVWMGTDGGIAIFDGAQISLLSKDNGLIDNRIDGLMEDQNGNIWVTTAYGLSVITPDTIFTYSTDNALIDNAVLDIFADSQGRVHVATNPGVTVFNSPGSYEQILHAEVIRDIIETRSGETWYASQERGIFVQGEQGLTRLGFDEGLTCEIVLSLMEDHQGRIWCGTYVEGIFVFENGMFHSVSSKIDSEPIATMIHEDIHKRIWIQAFEDGIWLYDDGKLSHYTSSNNLVNDLVEDLFEDRYGNIWVATWGGVSKYGRVIFETYDMDLGLPDNHVTSVYRDSRDRIWFGTLNGDLLYKQRDQIYILDERVGFPEGAMPLCFLEDPDHKIFVGTNRELLYFNGRSFEVVDIGLYWKYHQIFGLLLTPDRQLWCATDSGIYVHSGNHTFILGMNEGLSHQRVNDMLLVDQKIYCATEGGIDVFDLTGNHLASYTRESGLVSDVCLDLTLDSGGRLWVATNRGVSRLNLASPIQITSFNTDNGLTSNSTYFVELSGNNALWIGTERGIDVLNTQTGSIDYYGSEDGFYPLETNAKAIARGDLGELWIGTIAGLVHYSPKYDVVDVNPPDLILFLPQVEGTQFQYHSSKGGSGGNKSPAVPTFAHNKNSLVFSFTGIHTTIPSQNRFSYMLEGFDDDWSDPGTDRTASYRKLPNGNYVFRVKAFNLDGYGDQNGASFAFVINPPFWKTIWFIFFEVLAGLSLVYAFIKYRERQLVREKKILETRVKERTREIEDQKVEIEAQRDEISEQKNYVEAQRDQIALQNKEITDSILYAKRIQQAVLPGKITLDRTLPDHFILLKPRDIVSGDFYWVEEKNEMVIICAADCTGHGVPGAFMSLLGLTFLNEIVNKDEITRAGEILNRLRTYIIQSMSHKHEEADQARDGMDMSLIVIDKQLKMMEYAGAYNPLLIVRDNELIEYKADKMPIGKHVGEERPFANNRIDLKDKDMIYLYSDGFPDQFGGENGSKYMAKPFKRLLQRISSEPVEKQLELLDLELRELDGQGGPG